MSDDSRPADLTECIFSDDVSSDVRKTEVGETKTLASLTVNTLEPRILLSATLVDVDPNEEVVEAPAVEVGLVNDPSEFIDVMVGDIDDLFGDDADEDLFAEEADEALISSVETVDENNDAADIVLIDSSLQDVDILADAVDEDAIVILYDGNDGTIIDVLAQVEEMSEATGTEIASLSILSHGSGGEFGLGGETVSADMSAEQQAAWGALADNFTDDANIYIYGCEVVDGSGEGQELLDALSELTGAEVYGSDDTTGAGSDWDLEAVSTGGEDELAEGIIVPLDENVLSTYQGTLDVIAPTITARETIDSDGDGQIDQIKITTDENLDDDFSGLTIAVDGYTVSGYSSDIANDNIFYVDLVESGTGDTGATPTVTLTTNTTLGDASGNDIEVDVDSGWLDSAWQNRTKITFDNADQVTDDLDDYPVLVTISTANLASLDLSATTGADVRFADAITGNELKYEVESWDADTDTATIWVKVPRIDRASDADYIYVYYNHSGTATYDQSTADEQAVWSSGYEGVYHLSEDQAGVGTADVYQDSTTNANHGDDEVSDTGQAGQIGAGQEFDGVDDYVDIGSVGDDIDVSTGTVSAWIELNDHSASGRIFHAKVDANNLIALTWKDASSEFELKYLANGVESSVNIPGGGLIDEADGEQHFVALTWDKAADEVKVFLDGDQYGSTVTGLGLWSGSIADVSIGNNVTDDNANLDGMIDEVRVSSVARSADWVKASWLAQNSTFNNFGGEETESTPATIDNVAPTITSVETADLDDDGFIDAVHVTFSEAIDDSTVIANDWDVAGVTGESFVSTTNGDTADDSDIYITFADGVLDDTQTPSVSYTQDDPTDADVTDAAGNKLADFESAGSWWNSDWQSRTKITFDNTNSSEDLTDQAVLVTLTSSDVDFDKINADGADIRFVDNDGTLLDYEIDSWDDTPGSESASVWVKVQQVDQASNTDYIHLYYNNASATDAQNAANVWDSSTGVYHFDEDPDAGGAGDIKDSDGSANDGTAEASMTSDDLVDGKIGNALDFDGSDDYIDFTTTDVGDTFTIEVWIKPDSSKTGLQAIVSNSAGGATTDGFRFFFKDDGQIRFETGNGSASAGLLTDTGVVNGDVWNHIAVEVDRAGWTGTIYHNGVNVTSSGFVRNDFNTTSDWEVGRLEDNGSAFQGEIDELRVANVGRTADQIEASYLSQNGSFNFNTFSSEEEVETATVNGVNAAPIASDDAFSTYEGTALTTGNVLNNDTDSDGDTLSVDSFTQGSNGTVTYNNDGTFTYTPATNFDGTDTFTYTVDDGNGSTDTATVTVTVYPSSISMMLSTDGDVTSGGAPGDDTWTSGEAFVVDDPNLSLGDTTDGTFAADFNLDDFASDASANIDAIHFVHQDITIGSTTSLDLQAGDLILSTSDDETIGGISVKDEDVFVFRANSPGDYSSGTVFLLMDGGDMWGGPGNELDALTLIEQDTTVGGVTYDAGTFLIQTSKNGDVLHYDFTSVGSTTAGSSATFLDVSDINIGDYKIDSLELIETETTIGGVTLQAGELLVSTSDNDTIGDNSLWVSQRDIFSLNITATGSSSAATATMFFDGSDVGLDNDAEDVKALTLIDSAPTASDDSFLANQNEINTTGNVLSNDTDPSGDTLSVVSFTQAANGTVSYNNDGTFNYTPVTDFLGTDTFTYTVGDGDGNFDTGMVTITVDAIEYVPVAGDDAFTTDKNTPLTTGDVLSNDWDLDADTLSVASFTQGSNGTVSYNNDGTFNYTPTNDFVGTDTFTYTVDDGKGNTDTATVTVSVNSTNVSFMLSTDNNVTAGGAPGDDTWTDGEAVMVDNPNLDLGDTTDGTFSAGFDLDSFASDGNTDITAIHYVTQDITIGTTSTIDLQAGDLIFSTKDDETIDGLWVNDEDVVVFRADSSGFGSGSFFLLFDGSDVFGGEVDALTLIEADTDVGGVTYDKGTFLIQTSDQNDLMHYEFTQAGATTAATSSVFLDVDDINISNKKINGLELIETTTTFGGETVQAGELLISLKDDDTTVGDNSITATQHDIIKLNITSTGATSAATASILLDGSDVGLDENAEDINALTLVDGTPNASDDAFLTNENVGITTSNVLSNDVDPNGDTLSVVSFTQGTNGTVTYNDDGTFCFMPANGFTGTDTFTYTVDDGNGNTDVATVTVIVDALPNLDGHWDFNEATGQVANDITGNGNDGDLGTSTGSDTADPTWTNDPERGSVLTFDGVNDHVSGIGNGPTGSFTIAAWGKTDADASNTYNTLYSAGDEIWIGVAASDGSIFVHVGGSNDYAYTSVGAWTNDSWHHLTATWDGANVHLYLDGVDMSLTISGTLNDPVATTAVIGGYTPDLTSYGWEGSIDDVRVYDGAVNSAAAAQLASDPDATDDAYTTNENTAVITGSVLSNDTDSNGDLLQVTSFTQGGNGTVSYNNDGTFTYTPTTDYYGTDTFTYTVDDGLGNTDTATVTVTINGAPDTVADAYSVNEDANVITGNVLTNDSDPEGDNFSVQSFTQGAHSTVAYNNDGTFTFTPDHATYDHLNVGDTATETFTYTVADEHGATETGTVTMTITGTNDGPVASNESTAIAEDASATTINVLSNDTDVDDGATKTITSVSAGSNGSVVAITNAGADLTFTPNHAFYDHLNVGDSATETFTYTVTDDQGATDTATVTITINGTNDGPVVAADASSIAEDASATTIDVLSNDSDVDDGSTATITAVTQGSNGSTVAITNAGADLSFTPDHDTYDHLNVGDSATETFTYTVTDDHGATSTNTVTITINGTNDGPVAATDAPNIAEDASATTINVLSNDSDVDDGSTATITAVSAGSNGSAIAITNAGADLTFTPDHAFYDHLNVGDSATEIFTYTVTDDQGATDTATVTVTITGTNDGPIASDEATAIAEDASATTINVLSNDTDVDDGATKTITSVSAGSNGSVVAITNAGADLTFTPDHTFYDHLNVGDSATETFTYTVTDDQGATDTATVTITINGTNDGPVVAADASTIAEDASATTINVLSNDSDVDDGSTSTITSVSAGSNGSAIAITNTGADLTFTPDHAFYDHLNVGDSATETFTYTVTDDQGATSTATVTVTISGTNDGPVASDEATNIAEDASATTINVLSNDTDVDDGATKTITSVSAGSNGSVVAITNAGADLTFTPDHAFYDHLNVGDSATETFTYTVTDDQGATDTATVTITINGTNDGPVVAADASSIAEDASATTIDVLSNDSDVDDGSTATITAVTQGSNGSAVVITNAGADLSFTPDHDTYDHLNVGDSATETFTYTVTDDRGATSTATVTVTISGTNDGPVASDEATNIAEDASATTINVLSNDTDVDDASTKTITAVSAGSNGSAINITNSGADLTFTPDHAFYDHLNVGDSATETFTYTVTDDQGATDTATVTITINGTNDGPVASNEAVGIAEDASATTINVLSNDSDVDDASTKTITAVSAGSNGSAIAITNAGADLTFTPDHAFYDHLNVGDSATETFTYTVTDDQGATDTATVTITISGTNDGPIAVTDAQWIAEDASATTINVLSNDTDVDDASTKTITAVSAGSNGSAIVITNGGADLTFAPDHAFYDHLNVGDSATETFTYTVTDDQGATSTATVTVTINGTNDGPVASNEAANIAEDASATTISVLSNDTDVDDASTKTITAVSAGSNGSAINITNAGADLTFTPDHAFYDHLNVGDSATETFTYTVTDDQGATDTATVTITINGTNDGPVASNEAVGIAEDASATTINVLSNDTDVDDSSTATITSVSAGSNGSAIAITNAGADLTFTPDHAYYDHLNVGDSATETFTYTVTDDQGATDTATVTVTISGTNDGPVAVGEAQSIAEDASATTINVLSNDTDVDDASTKTITSVSTGSNGSAINITNSGADLTFTPDHAFYDHLNVGDSATETFTYTVTDDQGATDTATVTITINGTNDGPVASNEAATIAEDASATTINVLSNDSDVDDGSTATITSVSAGSNGSVIAITNTGADLTFTPDHAFYDHLNVGDSATETFSYTVTDDQGATDTATVTITISGTNDGPIAVADAQSIAEDASATTINVLSNDSDVDDGSTKTITAVSAGSNGSAIVITNAGADLTFAPDDAFYDHLNVGDSATETFTYTVTDDQGATSTATVTVTINGTNDGPVASNEAANIAEDASATTINVLSNDTDIDDASTRTITAVSAGSNGSAINITNAGADLTFTPDHAFYDHLNVGDSATETFTYTVTDDQGATDTATVTITINGTNDGPVASNEAVGIAEDASATTISVLSNDSDVDDASTKTITAVSAGSNGSAIAITNAGADLTFTPDHAFYDHLNVGDSATETFTYTVTDDQGATDTATVTITISGTNDGPIAVADAQSIAEDASATTINVLSNDTDVDDGSTETITSVSAGSNGSAIAITNAGADLTFAPDHAFYDHLNVGDSATETFTYTVTDDQGATSTATVTVTINGTNDGPVASGEAATIAEDASATTINVLSNDTDVDDASTKTITAVTAGSNGSAIAITNAGADLTFAPDHAFYDHLNVGDSATETFTYTVTDDQGATDTATVTVTINGTNDGPVAAGDATTIADNAAATTINVLSNDSDVDDGSTATITAVTQGSNGSTVAITNSGADLAFTPDHAAWAHLDVGDTATETFTYTITDDQGATDTATVTITISGTNDGPVATADATSIAEDSSATTINVSSNDTDADGSSTATITAVTQGSSGSVVAITNAGADLTFTPDHGTYDHLNVGDSATETFTYTVTDDHGATSTATVTVTITGTNDGPVAATEAMNIAEDASATTINVLSNDSDVDDGSTATITSVTAGSNGSVVAITNAGADLTFTPDHACYDHLELGDTATETFTYTVTDDQGATDTSTVTITITGTNDGPVAVADTGFADEDGSAITLDLLGNDSDVDDNSTATITAVTQGSNGSVVTITNSGADVSFTPDHAAYDTLNVGDTATETFTYTVTDDYGATATQTVTITINGTNDADAAPDFANIDEDASAMTISVLDNDIDVDTNSTQTITDVSQGTSGSLVVITNAGADLTYTPNHAAFDHLNVGDTTTETFTYEMIDDQGATARETVTMTITGTNDGPVATADSTSIAEDTAATTIDVLANDTDVDDGSTKTITAVSAGSNGSTINITNSGADLSFTPDHAFYNHLNVGDTATETFTYTVTDDQGATDTTTVTITINGTNDGPVASDEATNIAEDASATTINVLNNDSDVDDGSTATITSVSVGSNGSTVAITNAGADLTFTPDHAFYDHLNVGDTATETFNYTVTDDQGGTDTATVTITVSGTNDGPVAVANALTIAEDAAATTINVLANDTDVDDASTRTITAVTGGSNGSAVVITNAGSDLSFTPDHAFYDHLNVGDTATETFTYTVTDDQGATDTATVTITISGTNDGPVAVVDAASIAEDAATTTINVLSNDSDGDDGSTATITAVSAGSNGSVIAITNSGSDLTFTPDHAAYDHLKIGETATETFTYTVTDDQGVTDTATVTVTITGTNDGPIAAADATAIVEDTSAMTISVLNNDADPDGDSLSINSFTQGANGTVSYNNDGTFAYTPNANFNGTDTFTYTVDDGNGSTATATVTVTVQSDADAPLLNVVSVALGEEGTAIGLQISSTLTDSSETLSIRISGVPNGAVLANGVDQGGGVWLLQQGDLAGLTVTSSGNNVGNFQLAVQAISEDGSGNMAITAGTIDVTVDPVVPIQPREELAEEVEEEVEEEIDWSRETNLHVLDPGVPENEIEATLTRVEHLLERSLSTEDDDDSPLYMVGDIVGGTGHQGIQLPKLDEGDSVTYSLKPLTHMYGNSTRRVEHLEEHDHSSEDTNDSAQVRNSDANDEGTQWGGVFSLFWGLVRGAGRIGNSEENELSNAKNKSGKRK